MYNFFFIFFLLKSLFFIKITIFVQKFEIYGHFRRLTAIFWI